MILVTAAAVFAAESHAGQVRKELGEPYIIHPLRVGKMAAEVNQSDEFVAACYLHDVVEDTNVQMATIESLFPPRTVLLVNAMTKWWGTGHPDSVVVASKAAYYSQIMATPGASLLKVLDRADNLNDFAKIARMAPRAHKWAERYYRKTVVEIAPLLVAMTAHEERRVSARVTQIYEVALTGLKVAVEDEV